MMPGGAQIAGEVPHRIRPLGLTLSSLVEGAHDKVLAPLGERGVEGPAPPTPVRLRIIGERRLLPVATTVYRHFDPRDAAIIGDGIALDPHLPAGRLSPEPGTQIAALSGMALMVRPWLQSTVSLVTSAGKSL